MDFNVKFVVLFQKRTFNNIEKVSLMLVPILTRQLSSHIGELMGKIITRNAVVALQHDGHNFFVLFLQLPQPRSTGMFTGAGVGNIEHIAQPRSVSRIVH